MKQRTRGARLATAIVVSLAAAMLGLAGCGAGGVPEDRVKQEVAASSFAAEGFVGSSYVNESPYELAEFKVEGQQDEEVNALGIEKARRVSFSGKLKNDSFESTFTGHAYYVKNDDSWETLSGPSSDTNSTAPLKGVDTMTLASSNPQYDNVVHSNFQSTFEEKNGRYTSQATETVAYEFWFADDTATNTQDFVFDPAKGWTPNGDAKASDLATTYKLAGKTFGLAGDEGLGSFTNTPGKCDASFTFADVSEDAVSASYAYDFTPKEDKHIDYLPISFTGTAVGKPSHEFGKDSFSFELNDKENAVTFSCRSKSPETVAGTGTVNAMTVDVSTNSPYRSDYSTFYSAEDLKFAEKV